MPNQSQFCLDLNGCCQKISTDFVKLFTDFTSFWHVTKSLIHPAKLKHQLMPKEFSSKKKLLRPCCCCTLCTTYFKTEIQSALLRRFSYSKVILLALHSRQKTLNSYYSRKYSRPLYRTTSVRAPSSNSTNPLYKNNTPLLSF